MATRKRPPRPGRNWPTGCTTFSCPASTGLNERLKDGLNSGWTQLQGRLGDQADAYSYTLQQVALASGAVTEEQITKAGSFTKALQQNGVSAQLLKASLDEAQTSAEKLLTLSDKEMAAKHYDRETIQRMQKPLRS